MEKYQLPLSVVLLPFEKSPILRMREKDVQDFIRNNYTIIKTVVIVKKKTESTQLSALKSNGLARGEMERFLLQPILDPLTNSYSFSLKNIYI